MAVAGTSSAQGRRDAGTLPSALRARLRASQGVTAREDLVWFAAISLLALVGGYWLLYVAQIYVGDALARAANAQNIAFSRDAHVAAIGFIWPPLPSMLELPLIAALRPIGQAWFAPQIVTACFTGLTAMMLNRLLALLGLRRRWRILFTLAVLANPLIAYSAINGLTENLFIFFALVATYFLLDGSRRGAQAIAPAGLAIGLGFLVRYEAIAFAGGAMLALFIIAPNAPPTRERQRVIDFFEAQMTALIAPVAFLVSLWLLWNFLFEGNALFFLRGVGSNEFYTYTSGIRSSGATGELARAYGSLVLTALLTARRLATIFAPYLPALATAVVVAWRTRDRQLAALAALAVSVPVFTALEVYRGQLFEWVRFWSEIVPFGVLLLAGCIRHIDRRFRSWILGVAVAALFASAAVTGATMAGTVSSPDEQAFIHAVRTPTQAVSSTLSDARHVAHIIDTLPPNATGRKLVAIDAFVHVPLVLLVRHPGELVIASDRDFQRRLADPRNLLDYVLIPEPNAITSVTDINRAFPGAYQSGGPFLQLVDSFPALLDHGGARLYRITPAP